MIIDEEHALITLNHNNITADIISAEPDNILLMNQYSFYYLMPNLAQKDLSLLSELNI